MHPPTVIVMIAIHLFSVGALVFYVSRRLPDQRLLLSWSIAALMMGAAYVGRLMSGLRDPPPSSFWVDALLVTSQLMFITGVRELLGQARQLRRVIAAALVFACVQGLVTYGVGPDARFVVLNAEMGVLYIAMGSVAVLGLRSLDRESKLRHSLMVFGFFTSTLGCLSLLRAWLIGRDGSATMYEGWFPALYFSYGSLVAVLLAVVVVWHVFERMSDALRRSARYDPLTGTLNRNGLRHAIAMHFAPTHATPIVWLALDVDHFKRVNDAHGHATGDALLRAIGRTLLAHCRDQDIVARMGGEEFLVGYAGADIEQASQLAERLRLAVMAVRVRGKLESDVRCTVSVGISRIFGHESDWERAAVEADRALYAAKAAGRDRCARFDPSTTWPAEAAANANANVG
jgi:diguanylate cyclase (GGDEF)-like protein